MSNAAALDHVGVVGRDVAALAAAFERLGFCLTPLARHEGGRTGNRNIMLRQGYLELLSVVGGGHSATLDRFLARYDGIHILAFAIDDPDATLARLRRAGIGEAAIMRTERAVDDADPDGPRAGFTLITTPDVPAGRVHLIRHDTPDALWQDRFLHHPNRAVALEEVIIVSDQPAQAAAGLSLRAGRPLLPDPAGGYRLALQRGCVRIVAADAARAVLPDIAPPSVPWIAGVTVRTDDRTVALRHWLDGHAIPHGAAQDDVSITAGGVALRFV
jgi:hypothetical protein